MDLLPLLKPNLPRKQKGQRIETPTAFCLRYYENGKQKFNTLAYKGGTYRSWNDVEPLIENILCEVNGNEPVTPQQTLTGLYRKALLTVVRSQQECTDHKRL